MGTELAHEAIGDFGTVEIANRWQESPIAGAEVADRWAKSPITGWAVAR
ncbi:hypothetical protein [Agrococcus sp. SGAir0287]|nr:hypothetical protein [Agrococcus sp. SGAir0287]